MQSTVAQVFSLTDLANFPDVSGFRAHLGKKRYFYVEGVTRMFSTHVLRYVDTLHDLAPSLTIVHPTQTFHVPRKLVLRVSSYFRELEQLQRNVTTADSYNVQDNISQIGLEHIIDTAHGRGLHLERLNENMFDRVIFAADHFKVDKILRTAAKMVRLRAQHLNVQELIYFASRIHALSHYFQDIFTDCFALHLQRLVMRSQYVEESELRILVEHLAQFRLPLALEFKHWTIDPDIVIQLSSLRVEKLNLLFCNGVIDLTQFKRLQELRGNCTNFTNLQNCKHLELLNVDVMPPQLPRSLRELTLRDATPKPSDLLSLERLHRVSLHHPLDAADLPGLANEKIRSLKISSKSGNLTSGTIHQIGAWQLTQLTLIRVGMSSNITHLPPLENLREATLNECDLDTVRWVLSASGLEKLRLKIENDETLDMLPRDLAELSLDFNGPASALTSLTSLRRLHSLRLSDIRWSEGGLGVLSSLTTLGELSIHVSGHFLPGDITSLTQLQSLSSFSFNSHTANSCFPTTEAELVVLGQLASIESLKVRPAMNLLPKLDLLTRLEGIETLDLFGTNFLEWTHLPRLSGLKELRLVGCRWMNLTSDSDLSLFPILSHLEIPHLTGERADLFRQMTSLETLILDQ